MKLHKAPAKSEFKIESIDDVIDPDEDSWVTLEAKRTDPDKEIKKMYDIWIDSDEIWDIIIQILKTRYDIENLSKYSKVGRYMNKYFKKSPSRQFIENFKPMFPTIGKRMFHAFKKYVVDPRAFDSFPKIKKYIKTLLNYLNS